MTPNESSRSLRVMRSLLAAAIVLATSNIAQAEWPPPGDYRRGVDERPHVIFGELGLYTTSDDAPDSSFTVVSFLFGGYFRVIEPLELGVLVPFMFATLSQDVPIIGPESESQLHSGNPYIQAAYRGDFDAVTLRIGGGLALPFSRFGDDIDEGDFVAVIGLAASAGLRGLWNPWLWVPEQFTIVLPNARADFDLHPNVVFAAETGFGIMIDTSSSDADDETDVTWQLAVEGGGRFAEIFEPGLRLQLVTFLNSEGDQAQLSLTPFVRLDFGAGFVEARLTMNLDDSLGFAFDEDKVWGLRFLGGGRF
jgi:hypothetical protein